MESLVLDMGSKSSGSIQAESIKLHPVPMFGMLDHHIRRNEDQQRVIGALIGTVTGGVVEITNSFPVHHSERNDEISIGRPNLEKMLELNKKVHPNEQVVGWYSTTPSVTSTKTQEVPMITDFSVAVHNFFQDFVNTVSESSTGENSDNPAGLASPVHLVVDTSLTKSTISFNAYTASTNRLLKEIAVVFTQIKVNIAASDAERIGLDAMVRGKELRGEDVSSLSSELDGLESAIDNLRKMLTTVSTYVEGVVGGKRNPDPTVGRLIADTLSAVPHIDPAQFHSLFNSSLQDLLMVTYLSSLTQAQLSLAERISNSVKSVETEK